MNPLEKVALLADVPLLIEAELGRTSLAMRRLLELKPGSLVPLPRAAGENMDVRVSGALIGCGEMVVSENMAGVRITDLKGEA